MTTDNTAALAPRLEDQLAGMNWGTLDDAMPRIAPFGTFGWYHGNKAGKTPGAFYARDTEFATPPGAPWVVDDRFADGQQPETGYSATMLKLAFLGARSQWFMTEGDDEGERESQRKRWLTTYQAGAKKQVEWLVFVEGVDAPMILSGSKFTKTKPFSQILNQYRRGLLKQAGLRLRRTLPLWAFWLPIAGDTKDGKPVYDEAKDGSGKSFGSFITTPKLYLPDGAIDSLFVGPQLLQEGADLRRQYAWWFEEVRLPHGVVEAEYEIEEVPALPAPRNVPQPVESDADLPF